ncbi:unnamed protein product [Closterium sp. NIES-65]|nr:unnamed protein product [Closterium sp. NIES-65]
MWVMVRTDLQEHRTGVGEGSQLPYGAHEGQFLGPRTTPAAFPSPPPRLYPPFFLFPPYFLPFLPHEPASLPLASAPMLHLQFSLDVHPTPALPGPLPPIFALSSSRPGSLHPCRACTFLPNPTQPLPSLPPLSQPLPRILLGQILCPRTAQVVFSVLSPFPYPSHSSYLVVCPLFLLGQVLSSRAALVAFGNDPGLLHINLDTYVESWTCALCNLICSAALDSTMTHIASKLHSSKKLSPAHLPATKEKYTGWKATAFMALP